MNRQIVWGIILVALGTILLLLFGYLLHFLLLPGIILALIGYIAGLFLILKGMLTKKALETEQSKTVVTLQRNSKSNLRSSEKNASINIVGGVIFFFVGLFMLLYLPDKVEYTQRDIVKWIAFLFMGGGGIAIAVGLIALLKKQSVISSQGKFCSNCGKRLTAEDSFCPGCGRKVE